MRIIKSDTKACLRIGEPMAIIEIPIRRTVLYTFRVEGNCLGPRIFKWDIVVVVQESEFQVGDLVVVKSKEGKTLLRWLKRKDTVCLSLLTFIWKIFIQMRIYA